MPEKANIAQAIVRTEDQFRDIYFHTNWQEIIARLPVNKISYDEVSRLAATVGRVGHLVTLTLNQSKTIHILKITRQ